MMSPAQLERQQSRRGRLAGRQSPASSVSVPDDAAASAASLVEWIGDNPERAAAAAAVNDARDKPWATVQKHIDGLT